MAGCLSSNELERYSRQLMVPGMGLQRQQQLKHSKVLIVGAGGLGCPAAAYLAGAGVGVIGIVDHDYVEMSNLHRQIAHSMNRLGMRKALSLIEFLQGLNPEVAYEPYLYPLTYENAANVMARYDVILDCTDNSQSRYLISDVCVLLGKPLVSGAALRAEGQLTCFNTPPVPQGLWSDSPCYRCMWPTASDSPSCGEAGIIGPVVGIMGTMQALETIRIIAGRLHVPATEKYRLWFFAQNVMAVTADTSHNNLEFLSERSKTDDTAHIMHREWLECANIVLGRAQAEDKESQHRAARDYSERASALFRTPSWATDESCALEPARTTMLSANLKTVFQPMVADSKPDAVIQRSPPEFRSFKVRQRRQDCSTCGRDAFKITTLESVRSGANDVKISTSCALAPENECFEGISVDEYGRQATAGELGPHNLLDVRTPEVFSVSSIKGALNVPITTLRTIASLPSGSLHLDKAPWLKPGASRQPVFVVCRTGIDSAEAVTLLRRLDHTYYPEGPERRIENVIGGMKAWTSEVDSSMTFL